MCLGPLIRSLCIRLVPMGWSSHGRCLQSTTLRFRKDAVVGAGSTKLDFESQDDVFVLTENRRQHLLEQRRSSSKGLNALHTQLESHILRLQKHSDELRGELGQAGPC
eukprot:symbB.v1.2.010277.t1/scaffold619.1/size180033/13